MPRSFRLVDVPKWKDAASKITTFELTLRDARGWDGQVTVTRGWLEKNRPMVDGFVTFPGKAAIGSLATYSPVEPAKLADWNESDGPTVEGKAQDSSYRAETAPETPISAETEDFGDAQAKPYQEPTPETVAADIEKYGQVIDVAHFDGDTMTLERVDPGEFMQEYDALTGKPVEPGNLPQPPEGMSGWQHDHYPKSLLDAPLTQEERKLVKDLRAAVQAVGKENVRLKEQAVTDNQLIEALKQDHGIMRHERDRADAMVVDLRGDVEKARAKMDAADRDSLKIAEQNTNLRAALAAEQKAHTDTQVQMQDLAGRRHDLIAERDELQAKYDELEGNHIDAKGEIELQAATIVELQSEIAGLKQAASPEFAGLKPLQDELEKARYRIVELNTFLNDKQELVDKLAANVDELRSLLTVSTSELESKKLTISDLVEKIGALSREKNDMDNALEQGYRDAESLRRQVRTLELAVVRWQEGSVQPTGEYAPAQASVAELEGRLRDTIADRQRFYEIAQDREKTIEQLRNKLANITQPEGLAGIAEAAIEERNEAIKVADQRAADIEKLTGRLTEQTEELMYAKRSNVALHNEEDKLNKELTQLRESLQTAQMRVDELELEIEDFKANSHYGAEGRLDDGDIAPPVDPLRTDAISLLEDDELLGLDFEQLSQLETGMLRYLADLAEAGESSQVKSIAEAMDYYGWKRWTTGESAPLRASQDKENPCPCTDCVRIRAKLDAEAEADRRYPLPQPRKVVENFGKMLAEEVTRPSYFSQMAAADRDREAADAAAQPAPKEITIHNGKGEETPTPEGCVRVPPGTKLGGGIIAGKNVFYKVDLAKEFGEHLTEKANDVPNSWADYDPAKHSAGGIGFVDTVRIVPASQLHDLSADKYAPTPEAQRLASIEAQLEGLHDRLDDMANLRGMVKKLQKRLKKMEAAK